MSLNQGFNRAAPAGGGGGNGRMSNLHNMPNRQSGMASRAAQGSPGQAVPARMRMRMPQTAPSAGASPRAATPNANSSANGFQQRGLELNGTPSTSVSYSRISSMPRAGTTPGVATAQQHQQQQQQQQQPPQPPPPPNASGGSWPYATGQPPGLSAQQMPQQTGPDFGQPASYAQRPVTQTHMGNVPPHAQQANQQPTLDPHDFPPLGASSAPRNASGPAYTEQWPASGGPGAEDSQSNGLSANNFMLPTGQPAERRARGASSRAAHTEATADTVGGLEQPGAEAAGASADDKEQSRFMLRGVLPSLLLSQLNLPNIALGEDIGRLSLDLDRERGKSLASTFASPWEETSKNASPATVDPYYTVPACYNIPNPPPVSTKITHFSDETLFYIFYTFTRDELQDLAAQELTQRNWRFHKEWRLWLTRDPHTEPVQRTAQYERAQCIFWDPVSWDRVAKEVVLIYESLEDRSRYASTMAQSFRLSKAAAAGEVPRPTADAEKAPSPSAAPV